MGAKMKRIQLLIAISLMCLSATSASAGITTLFASSNGGAFGGGVYFDATIAGADITVTGLDTNTKETDLFTGLKIYTRVGTAFGNEGSVSGWSLVATGSGTGAGEDNPTAVTLSNPFVLDASTQYGIAIVMPSNIGHDYTNGDGGNQYYANADLSLTFGTATNVAFTGEVFDPRVWNGTIDYNVNSASPVPVPSALLLGSLGMGCVNWIRRRRTL
jgi:hypothetical protein